MNGRHRPRWVRFGGPLLLSILVLTIAAVLSDGRSSQSRVGAASADQGAKAVGEGSKDRDSASNLESEKADWDHPFIDGEAVGSAAAARTRVNFALVAPDELGTPKAVFVHRGQARARQGVGLVYASARYGRFLIVEKHTLLSESALDGIVERCHAADVCEGTWEVITLSKGIRALRVAAPVSSVVLFMRGGIAYDVYGPAETFTPSAATAVGEAIIRGM